MMENRRRDYRHRFPPHERHEAELIVRRTGESLRARMVDLSMSGMRLQLPHDTTAGGGRERVRIRLPIGEAPLTLDAELIHRVDAPESSCGLHILPVADVTVNDERERRLCQFLLEAQRRERRIRWERLYS